VRLNIVHTRRPFAEPVCSAKKPVLAATGNRRHAAACHMVDPASGHSRAGRSFAEETSHG